MIQKLRSPPPQFLPKIDQRIYIKFEVEEKKFFFFLLFLANDISFLSARFFYLFRFMMNFALRFFCFFIFTKENNKMGIFSQAEIPNRNIGPPRRIQKSIFLGINKDTTLFFIGYRTLFFGGSYGRSYITIW